MSSSLLRNSGQPTPHRSLIDLSSRRSFSAWSLVMSTSMRSKKCSKKMHVLPPCYNGSCSFLLHSVQRLILPSVNWRHCATSEEVRRQPVDNATATGPRVNIQASFLLNAHSNPTFRPIYGRTQTSRE